MCACCRGRRQPKDPVGRHRERRASRCASLDSQGHWYSKPSARRTGPLLTRSRISSWRDLLGQEGEGNYPLRGHGAAPTSPPGGVLRLMPSTSTRDACLTSSDSEGVVGHVDRSVKLSSTSGALRCLLRLGTCSGSPLPKPAHGPRPGRSAVDVAWSRCAGQLPPRPAARIPGWVCGRRRRMALRRAAPPRLRPMAHSSPSGPAAGDAEQRVQSETDHA